MHPCEVKVKNVCWLVLWDSHVEVCSGKSYAGLLVCFV